MHVKMTIANGDGDYVQVECGDDSESPMDPMALTDLIVQTRDGLIQAMAAAAAAVEVNES